MVDRLPFDLLTMVFAFAVGRGRHDRNVFGLTENYSMESKARPNLRLTMNPLRLGAVCKRWRDVAFSEPALWSRINLGFNGPLEEEDTCALIAEWLARTGCRLLTLICARPLYNSLDLEETPEEQKIDDDAQRMLHFTIRDLLVSILPRCEVIHWDKKSGIHLNLTEFKTVTVKTPPALVLPSLEELCLTTPTVSSGLKNIDMRSMPRLHTILLPTKRYSLFKLTDTQYDALRVIHAEVRAQELYELLERTASKSLEEVSVNVLTGGRSSVVLGEAQFLHTKSTLVLPKLKHLRISSLTGVAAKMLLDKLNLPALVTLDINVANPPYSRRSTWEELQQWLKRTRPPLRRLTLRIHVQIPEEEFLQVLSALSTLNELEIVTSGDDRTEQVGLHVLVQEALRRLTAKPICPNLKVLTFHTGDPFPQLVGDALSDVAEFEKCMAITTGDANTSSDFLKVERH